MKYGRLCLCAIAAGASCAGLASAPDKAPADGPTTATALYNAFQVPPNEARPLVWWHWMNGNITQKGIRADLEWMKRAGIGGVQNFQIDLRTPQIVDRPLAFMSNGWKDAFRFAASEADRLGLEMAVASSPGFSETGGPWVRPEDAMKKIAWSETIIDGGKRFHGKLGMPPAVTGSFQDMPLDSLMTPLLGKPALPSLYRDSMVFAYRVPGQPTVPTFAASVGGRPINATILADQSYFEGITLPKGTVAHPTIVSLELERPQVVQTVTVSMRGAFQLFQPNVVVSKLEASSDGVTWRKVVDIGPNLAPTTFSFKPVEAKLFRLVLFRLGSDGPSDSGSAPGFDTSAFDMFKTSPEVELTELRLTSEARIDRWEAKAGFASMPERYDPVASQETQVTSRARDDFFDISGRMKADGTLDWNPPPGTWKVVRMGWSLVGTTNHPAPADSTGLEVDKLDSAAVRRYLETYLAMLGTSAGQDLIGKRGVQALLLDSTEVGTFNWTPRLLEHFQALRGYDPRPWLPTLTGAIVGSRAESDAFLYDYRRTLAELHSTQHYATVAEVAHEHGLKLYGEALEGSSGSPGDDLDMRRYADIPMGAQWTGKPQPAHEADMRGAASVAHFYGKNIVAAESLTSSSRPWGFAPSDLRKTIDLIFASGVNRPIIHTSVHVPRDDMIPGLSLWIYGQYFNRLETWAEMARPWMDYIARSSVLLQAGRPVADVAYFYGEERPLAAMSAAGLPTDLPPANGYDFVSAKAIVDDMRVDHGDLIGPGGARYKVLFLGGTSNHMTLRVLRRIEELVEAGATVVGKAPSGSPGLDGFTPEYTQLVRKLWPGGEVAKIGRGQVIADRDVVRSLQKAGVPEDFAIETTSPDLKLQFVHRRLPDGEIYFLNRRSGGPKSIAASFNVTGKAPEIWNAESGTKMPASYKVVGNRTVVQLDMADQESLFVVFLQDTAELSRFVPGLKLEQIGEINGPWEVAFQARRGAPKQIILPQLASLSEHPDPGVRYFSGISIYSRSFIAPPHHVEGKPLLIDLGEVGDLAEVRVNGKLAGTAWHAPFRVEVGRLTRPGRNTIEIRVGNLWVNRLIGDAQPGAQPITYTASPSYKAEAPLRRSGLIGPVRLLQTGP